VSVVLQAGRASAGRGGGDGGKGLYQGAFRDVGAMEMRYGLKSGIGDSERMFKGFEYFLLYQFDFDKKSRFPWRQGG
jgi:hypothetical protein